MWWLIGTAAAGPCEDALEMRARGLPPKAIAAIGRDLAWTPDDVACLAAEGAHPRVVRVASRAARVPAPPDGQKHAWALAAGPAALTAAGLATPALAEARVSWFARPEIGFELTGGLGVRIEKQEWHTDFTYRLGEPVPQEDALLWQTTGALVFAPISGSLHVARSTLDLRAFVATGGGVVRTEDDLHGVFIEDRSTAWTAVENHAAIRVGAGFEVLGNRHTGLRFSADALRWVETYEQTALFVRSSTSLAVLLTTRP